MWFRISDFAANTDCHVKYVTSSGLLLAASSFSRVAPVALRSRLEQGHRDDVESHGFTVASSSDAHRLTDVPMNLTLNAISRLTLGLVGLTVSLVFVAYMWGMLPDRRAEVARSRQRLSESLAIVLLALENQSSQERIDDFVRQVVDHNSDIQSIGIRRNDDAHVVLDVGNHAAHWGDHSTSAAASQMSVPLGTTDDDEFRELEIRFTPMPDEHGWSHFVLPPAQFTTLLVVFGFAVFCFYFRSVVEQLHPRQTFEAVAQLEQVVHQLNQSTEEVKRQNRELEILATRDSLTGCCNRRCFFQEFDACWELAQNAGEPLAALMLDIDYF